MSDHMNEHDAGGTALEERLRRESTDAWETAPSGLHDAVMARIEAESGPVAVVEFGGASTRAGGRHWLGALALTGAAIAAAVIGMISLSGGTDSTVPVPSPGEATVAQVNANEDIAPTTRLGALMAGLSEKVRDFEASPPEEMILEEGRAMLSDFQSLVTNVGQRGLPGMAARRFAGDQ